MEGLYLVPSWFFGYDIALQIIFAIITFFVALYSYKIYKISAQEEPRLFGAGFFLISLSYIIMSILNFFGSDNFNDTTRTVYLKSTNYVNLVGVYAHIILLIAGLVLLTYMTLKIKSKKALLLMFLVTIPTIVLASNKTIIFYFIASVLLLTIIFSYVEQYRLRKSYKSLINLTAFILLFFGIFNFILNINNKIYYVTGHFLELVAYGLILVSLILVIKNGQKKKQT